MDNCTYNKFKLIHELSRLTGFIERYGRKDARAAKHGQCEKALEALHQDLHKHMEQLRKQLEGKRLR